MGRWGEICKGATSFVRGETFAMAAATFRTYDISLPGDFYDGVIEGGGILKGAILFRDTGGRRWTPDGVSTRMSTRITAPAPARVNAIMINSVLIYQLAAKRASTC